MVELQILHSFCKSKSTYDKYNRYVNLSYIKTNFRDIYKLYNVINVTYAKSKTDSISPTDLESLYLSSYPVLKDQERSELAGLISRVFASTVSDDIIQGLFEAHRQRSLAGQIAVVAIDVSEGKVGPEALQELYSELEDPTQGVDVGSGVEFVTDDLQVLYDRTAGGPGIMWPLVCLNRSLGPLRKGNFGFIYARPEVGKTTFLSHFVTNLFPSVREPVIWFNNEQPGEEVKLRLYQSAFGISVKELFHDREKFQELYQQKTQGLIKVVDSATIDRKTIEAVCKEHKPGLIIFDQIDKVHGFKDDDRNDLNLGDRYIWGRELAKEYCPIIGVTQADGSGENIKYLTMANVANAKTAKQAEADWILGIGATQNDDFALYRYFNISKNKLLGDENTDSSLRHGKFQVIIEPEIGRYKEV